MKIFYLFIWILFSPVFLIAQAPTTQWQRCLGGSDSDDAKGVFTATDGGYFVAGQTFSKDGDVTGQHGKNDFWITKLDKNGSTLWQRSLGGTNAEGANSIRSTPDGGCIGTGSAFSNDGDVIGQHGGTSDGWVVKLDKNGVIQWQRCLGGRGGEGISAVDITIDGGYIVAGSANFSDGDVSGVHGNQANSDAWVVKLDKNGAIQWQRCLGGSGSESANSIKATRDGNYIVAGSTNSSDGDVSGHHGNGDAWVVKLDKNGNIKWQHSLGGTEGDIANGIDTTANNGCIIAGTTISNNGDVKGLHNAEDVWVVKLDSIGTIQWQHCLGGVARDNGYAIQTVPKGGFIVTGWTMSYDDDVKGKIGSFLVPDVWLVKLDNNGAIQWQRCLGGTASDIGTSVAVAPDGGYIVAGYTNSNDVDVSGYHGGTDQWVIKLAAETQPCMQVNATGKTSFCAGTSTVLSVSVVGGTAPYAYQWKKSTVNVGTTSSLTVTTAGSYSIIVTDSKSCSVASAGISITQLDPPAIPMITASLAAIAPGQSSTLQTVLASGLTLQWLLNNNPIAGATQATYTTTVGGNYSVRVMNKDSCSATSQAYTLNIITALLESFSGKDFAISVYPNPSSGVIDLKFDNQQNISANITVLVRDLAGRIIYQKQLHLNNPLSERLDLSNQSGGFYLLEAFSDNQRSQLRLFKH